MMQSLQQFARYEAYQDSGVAVIQNIPTSWSVYKLKNCLRAKITDGPHETPRFTDYGVPFLSVDGIQDGQLIFEGCRYVSQEDHLKFSRKCKIERNDILMGKAASTGKIARCKVDFEFSIWSPLALIKIKHQITTPSFVEYSLKAVVSQFQIDQLCTLNTQKNISMNDIPKIKICVPPLPEQTAIAHFLDQKTAEIDQAIALKTDLIERLKEYKQITIQHAVTRGLDPNTKMKASGVEWIGDIPEGWEVKKISHVAQIDSGATPDRSRSNYWGGSIPWIKTGEVNYEEIVDAEEYVTEAALRESSIKLAPVGTLLMAMYGQGITRGRVALLGVEATYNQACCGMLFSKLWFDKKYPFYFFMAAYPYIRESGNESSQMNLSTGYISTLKVACPPLAEQAAIVAHINAVSAKIDQAIDQAQQQIDKLSEYKTVLINAAVTGKIKVA